MSKKVAIDKAYKWQNGMVMVFGEDGEQLPEYQGEYSNVKEIILRVAPATAKFYHGIWRNKIAPVSKESW